jgi:hypothetical protein
MGEKMNSDSYFEIGSTHMVCQDYALHGQVKDMVYAIVSDGCSEAPHSEIGAQIMCHVAQYYVNLFYHTGAFAECSMETLVSLLGNSILTRVDEIRKLYPIDRGALQATLLITISFGKEPETGVLNIGVPSIRRTMVFAWGDGFIIEKQNTYTVVHELNFPSGAPYYLVTDQKMYEAKIEDPELIYKQHWISKKGTEVQEEKLDPFQGFFKEYSVGGRPISLTVCSDGLKSYQDQALKSVDLLTMAPAFVDYKSSTGVFVQRNMNFMKIANKKLQRTHYDDVSTAAILV